MDQVDTFGKLVKKLELENDGLRFVVSQMRQEYRSFVNRVWKEFLNPEPAPDMTKSVNIRSGSRLSTSRRYTLIGKKPDFKLLNDAATIQKSFTDVAENFLRDEATRTNSFSSIIFSPTTPSRKSGNLGETGTSPVSRNSPVSVFKQKIQRDMKTLSANEIELFKKGLDRLKIKNTISFPNNRLSETDQKDIDMTETRCNTHPNFSSLRLSSGSEDVQETFSPESIDIEKTVKQEINIQNEVQLMREQRSSTIGSRPLGEEKKFVPKNLFENLMVFGLTKESLKNRLDFYKDRFKPGNFIQYKPTAIYNFAEAAGLEQNVTLPEIEKFITPMETNMIRFGVKNINDHIFNKVVHKPQRKYKERYICPFRPKDEEVQISRWVEYADSLNPQNKLYAFCIKKGDYLILDSLRDNKDNFFYFDTIYCLLTYAPIPNFDFNLLVAVLDFISMKRKEVYSTPRNKKHPRDVDFSKLNTILSNSVLRHLQEILSMGPPAPEKVLSYDFKNISTTENILLEYKCSQLSEAYLELAVWGAHQTFSMFSLEDLNLIMSAILLEKPLIFFSKDMTILASVINTFLGLIFPLKYVCMLIPSVPPNSLSLFEAPMPFMIGVNRHEQYFVEKELDKKAEAVFVFLDIKMIYINGQNADLISFPKLDFILDSLDSKTYPYTSSFRIVTGINVATELIPVWNGQPHTTNVKQKVKDVVKVENNNGLVPNIFEHIRMQLETHIVDFFCDFMNSHDTRASSQDFQQAVDAKVQNEDVKEFLSAFQETQIFNSYPYSVTKLRK